PILPAACALKGEAGRLCDVCLSLAPCIPWTVLLVLEGSVLKWTLAQVVVSLLLSNIAASSSQLQPVRAQRPSLAGRRHARRPAREVTSGEAGSDPKHQYSPALAYRAPRRRGCVRIATHPRAPPAPRLARPPTDDPPLPWSWTDCRERGQ